MKKGDRFLLALAVCAILALGIFAILTWRESIANDRYMALDNLVFDKQTETYLLPADHLR